MDNNNFIASARELPHSIEAEQSVIGAVLADPSALPVVIEKIKPEYFYNEQHKAIYSIILRMFTSGQPVDIITVLSESSVCLGFLGISSEYKSIESCMFLAGTHHQVADVLVVLRFIYSCAGYLAHYDLRSKL